MAPMCRWVLAAVSAVAWGQLAAGGQADEVAALAGDDECGLGATCSLHALQRRMRQAQAPLAEILDEVDGSPLGEMLIADDLPAGWNASEGKELQANSAGTDCAMNPFARECILYLSCFGRPYCILGGYMVVPGKPVAGMESINSGNAASFDYLMSVAHSMCGGTGCVLITNPVHHRTQDQLHIHFRHYNAKGGAVKKRLEASVCGKGGWVPFNIGSDGCGSGKARAFNFFPGVFSQVANAYGGGSLASVGITVWSTSECGAGVKTIVLATTHCSIEHTISER
mmetsp:Transcript_109398/g.316231  ORF Transcript_109398/g.316231 Transcript_109398/m.316231 type:complete len:283 (+) Transcript_109398:70-918(+)